VIKYGAMIAVSLTAMAAAMCVVFAFRQIWDGPANLGGPAETGKYVPDVLYGANCAGCHGADGKGGAARGLVDPVFLVVTDEATIRRITAAGVPGTAMPAFATEAGGTLTDEQIAAIVRSIRAASTRAVTAGDLKPPPYSTSTAGDPERGGEAFATFCSRCHGADGRGGPGASSIVDVSYLSLVSDQGLRTTVIAGRPDLGAPDWSGNVPGRPMLPGEVSDVVAWLAAQRGRMR
jgi:mono/diheme cytochrome c family protein